MTMAGSRGDGRAERAADGTSGIDMDSCFSSAISTRRHSSLVDKDPPAVFEIDPFRHSERVVGGGVPHQIEIPPSRGRTAPVMVPAP